ncbi:class I SAM-dependent methyltransferase [Kitasatospora sp. NPDC049258]|uniref:class I SAM-dependent methyltransferase n=1 Tax=Kitasatospora sp. NPDC049258 TaxID=3155394 RepID=UPI003445CD72
MSDAQQRKAALAHTFSLVAEEYDARNGGFFNPVGARLVTLARPAPGQRVLDLGCGRGAVLFPAAEAVGPGGAAVGIDLAPGMVRRTAADAAARGLPQIRVALGDAERPAFPDGSFDLVLSSFAVIHTPDPAAAVAAAHRLLAPGGRFGYTAFGPDRDERWAEPTARLAAFAAGPERARGRLRAAALNRLAGDPAAAADLLAEAGFTEVRSTEHEAVSHYRDPQAWWDALWASGRRSVLEAIPAERLPQARRAAFAALAPLAGPDGLTRRTAIRYTLATRPARGQAKGPKTGPTAPGAAAASGPAGTAPSAPRPPAAPRAPRPR